MPVLGPVLVVVALLILAWPLLSHRAERLRRTAGPGREAAAAAYWATVRARRRGLRGAALQETVCREVGCSPAQADAVIDLTETGHDRSGSRRV